MYFIVDYCSFKNVFFIFIFSSIGNVEIEYFFFSKKNKQTKQNKNLLTQQQKSAQEWDVFNYVLRVLVATNTGLLYLYHDDTWTALTFTQPAQTFTMLWIYKVNTRFFMTMENYSNY